MRSGAIAIWALAGLLLVACQGTGEHDVSSQALPIIGGEPAPNDDSIVMLVSADGQCTGTLISPTVVLTAAHCVSETIEAGSTFSGRVSFGPAVGSFFEEMQTAGMFAHRQYTTGLWDGFDIALVRLSQPAPDGVPIIPFRRDALDSSVVDQNVRAIGFGVTDGEEQTGGGTRRQVTLTISDLDYHFVVVGDDQLNTCQGDSGGPILLNDGNGEVVIGVTSFGQQGCSGASHKVRTDLFVDDFIDQVLAAWSPGPCSHDFECNPEVECDYPDPDCDVCGVDGICGTGCPVVDLDCPVGVLPGGLCGDDDDCEDRLCVAATDDPRVSFCTMPCDTVADCPAPLNECSAEGGGEKTCRFAEITPSTQGYPCSGNDECRSEICDQDEGICVEPCGAGGDCPDGFDCGDVQGVDSCTLPGGCSVAGNQHSALATGLMVLLALGLGRRRRRR
jgi:MYXO-CTERM domain-containing protein